MPSIERLREIRDAVRALANDIADREDLPTEDIALLYDTANELDELIRNGNNMSSIYHEDIAIRNSNEKKMGNNTNNLSIVSNMILAESVEDIANNFKMLPGDSRDILLEVVHRLERAEVTNGICNDWQNAALKSTDERDRLRVIVANREAEIELLKQKINLLERCVIQNALNTSRLMHREEEETDENIVFHAGRKVQHDIDHERHTHEDNICNNISDLENGEL